MNTGNVTVKRTTNALLAAYFTNRKTHVMLSRRGTGDLPVAADRQSKAGLRLPRKNP